MSHIYRFFLIVSSLMLTFAVFLISQKFSIFSLTVLLLKEKYPDSINYDYSKKYLEIASYAFYFGMCFLVSWIGFCLLNRMPQEQASGVNFKSFEIVNDTFIPVYLAYFFIALSVDNLTTFIIVFSTVFTFTYFSSSVCFDPLYIFRGYKLYAATSSSDVKSYIITRQIIKKASDAQFTNLRRLNDFTFIEVGGSQ